MSEDTQATPVPSDYDQAVALVRTLTDNTAAMADKLAQAQRAQVNLTAELARQVTIAQRATEAARQATDDMQKFRERVAEVALKVKDRENWCDPGFNEAMGELGLTEWITRDDVPVTVSFEVTVDGVAHDGPTTEQVEQAVRDYLRHHFDSNDWEEVTY